MNLRKLNMEKVKEFAVKAKEKANTCVDKVKDLPIKESASKVAEKVKALPISDKVNVLTEKVMEKYESSNVDLSFVKKIHFNLHHFTTVTIVAVLTFFVASFSLGYNTSSVNAAGLEARAVSTYNSKAIDVNYGDTKAIASIAKDILADQIKGASELTEISGSSSTYSIDDYVVSVEMESTTGDQKAKLSIQTKATYDKGESDKIVMENGEAVEIADGVVYTYNVKLNVIDTEAPKISFTKEDISIDDTDTFTLTDFLSVTDNVDGVMNEYSVEGEPTKVDDKLEAGKHVVTVRATDTSGNEASNSMIVRVYETEEDTTEAAAATTGSNSSNDSSSSAATGAANYAGAGSVASAALAQLGVNQDCTMLVTNALAAVGIHYHGWPAGYLSLGTVVSASEAQAGDLIYYADGGVGMAHIAVYIGGGQAVHGGYLGTTRIASAYMGSGPVFIRLN